MEIKQFREKQAAERWAEGELKKYLHYGKKAQNLEIKERLQAVDAFQILKGKNITLDTVVKNYISMLDKLSPLGIVPEDAINFALERLHPKGGDKTFQEVADELLDLKKQCNLRERSITDFQSRSRKISEYFGSAPIKKITASQLQEWLINLNLSYRSKKNYMMIVGEIFNFAVQKKYTLENPLNSLTKQEKRAIQGRNVDNFREPNILTINESRRLIETAYKNPELELLAAVTLGLFCGIRTEEIKRLKWKDIHLDENPPFITISAAIAKKRRIRHVDIPTNAYSWLLLCRKKSGAITSHNYISDYQKRFRKLQELAGFGLNDKKTGQWKSTWSENNMRHSYGTYDYALHGDPIRTARLLGHKATDDTLFDHYRALATKDQGKAYFNILPTKNARKIVPYPILKVV